MQGNLEESPSPDVPLLAGNGSGTGSEGTNDLLIDFPAGVWPESLSVGHDAFVIDEALFYEKLREFHTSFPEKKIVAEAAGEVLDLHLFYKEVTARGGFEQVIKEKKWDEVAHAVNFTCNIDPDLSFTLQKNYADLLYPLEQVFSFHMLHPPPGILPTLVTNSFTQHINQNFSSRKGRRRNNPNLLPESTKKKGSLVGKTLAGSIRTEFHGGYLVTVKVGTEMLNGLLYHELGSGDNPSGGGGVAKVDSGDDRGKRRESVGGMGVSHVKASTKRERKDGKRDEDAPLGARTAYHFFYAAQGERLKKKMPEGSSGGIRKLVTGAWKCLSEIEKMPYVQMSLRDKARHRREMQAYEEQQKKLKVCKMYQKGENWSNINGVGIERVEDDQSEQAKLRPTYLQEDNDCYHVSLDLEADAGDGARVPADVWACAGDIFCSGCLMDDSELLAHVGGAWSPNKDVSCYLPSFSKAT